MWARARPMRKRRDGRLRARPGRGPRGAAVHGARTKQNGGPSSCYISTPTTEKLRRCRWPLILVEQFAGGGRGGGSFHVSSSGSRTRDPRWGAHNFGRVGVGLPREECDDFSPAGQAGAQSPGQGRRLRHTLLVKGPVAPNGATGGPRSRRKANGRPCSPIRRGVACGESLRASSIIDPAEGPMLEENERPHARPPQLRGRRWCEQGSPGLPDARKCRSSPGRGNNTNGPGTPGRTSTSAAARSPCEARGTQPRFPTQSPELLKLRWALQPHSSPVFTNTESRVTLPPQSRQRQHQEPPHVGNTRFPCRPRRDRRDESRTRRGSFRPGFPATRKPRRSRVGFRWDCRSESEPEQQIVATEIPDARSTKWEGRV